MQKNSGFILVLALMILTVVLVITTQIFNAGNIFSLISRTAIDREKAKRLALSGVQIAMAELFTGTGEQPEEQKKLLSTLVPVINRWQTIELTAERDGFEGELRVCVVCEQGKFNLNTFYDFQKKKFIDEDKPSGGMRKVAEDLFRRVRDLMGGKDLFPAFEKLLKERGYPFNDVTELFASPDFSVFKNAVFYAPPQAEQQVKRPIYLTDLFTVSVATTALEPWLFSDAVCAVFDLARPAYGDVKKRSEDLKNSLPLLKQKMNWNADWDAVLRPLYGKDFTSLPKDIDSLLNSQFEPSTFSVVSYGKVGKISQRVLVVVDKHSKKRSGASPYIIKRMYWI